MRASVLVAVVALAASGCANQTASPQQDAVGTVSTFLEQCARNRPLNAMAELQPAAQHEFVDAGGSLAGCAHALRQTGLTARDFATATSALGSFTGEHAVVDVAIAGARVPVELTYGEGYWRIEGG